MSRAGSIGALVTRLWLDVLVAVLLAAWGVGCADNVQQGTIARVPQVVGPLGARAGAPVALVAPRDKRPSVEREGQDDKTKFFFTVAVVTHWERAGNYVTDDFAATANAPAELATALTDALRVSRAANVVTPEQKPAFSLETEIEHLYGTHYAVTDGTVVVLASKKRLYGGGAGVTTRQYASYGNVVLKARLVDHRTGSPVVVWEEHITGSGQAMPSKEHIEAAQTALRMAVSDAAGQLSLRVAAALDRLGQGPNAGYVLAGRLPSVFLVERVSRLRDFVETVYVETRSGTVLRHDITPLSDHAYARPGEWLLSRRTAEGVTLSGEGYEAYARALADKYDLRTYDDASRYHFFGVKGAVARLGLSARRPDVQSGVGAVGPEDLRPPRRLARAAAQPPREHQIGRRKRVRIARAHRDVRGGPRPDAG